MRKKINPKMKKIVNKKKNTELKKLLDKGVKEAQEEAQWERFKKLQAGKAVFMIEALNPNNKRLFAYRDILGRVTITWEEMVAFLIDNADKIDWFNLWQHLVAWLNVADSYERPNFRWHIYHTEKKENFRVLLPYDTAERIMGLLEPEGPKGFNRVGFEAHFYNNSGEIWKPKKEKDPAFAGTISPDTGKIKTGW